MRGNNAIIPDEETTTKNSFFRGNLNFTMVQKYLLIGTFLGLALSIRYALRSYSSNDMNIIFSWYGYILDHGGFWALKDNFADYNVPYLYLIALATIFKGLIYPITIIKSISAFFDLVLAFGVFRLVEIRYPGKFIPWAAFFIVLFAPTVIANGSLWGQCDNIYTAFLVWSLVFLCKGKPGWAMAAFGLSFSFKIQAVFFAPFLFVLFLKKVIPWRCALIVPAIYLALLAPAWIAGRPLGESLTIYLRQAAKYPEITLFAPNLYWVNPSVSEPLGDALLVPIAFALSFLAVAALVAIPLLGKSRITPRLLVLAATVSVITMPFFLPHMHERYFYPADIFTIALAFYVPWTFLIPIGFQLSSLAAYSPYLFYYQFFPIEKAAQINLVAWATLFWGYISAWLPVRPIPFLPRNKNSPGLQNQEN
ncbi:MAG TPA: hypothetical protein VMT46_13350 [Anaerolineaceae bacterium]|nr:hypothetical protein [Anaerolineaceae bacterium]